MMNIFKTSYGIALILKNAIRMNLVHGKKEDIKN